MFAGTAEFAVPSLGQLLEVADVAAVLTQPDRPGDRGRPAPRPVADVAESAGVRVLQPARLRAAEAVADVLALRADVLVVAAYGQIVPADLLDGHRLGGVNVHASILPRWRGAAPIAHAVLHGDAEVGVSIMQMDPGLDTGPVYRTWAMPMPERATTAELTPLLAERGADLLVSVLAEISAGTARAIAQPEEGMTIAPRLTREMGRVDWEKHAAAEVDRMVRALTPWPGVTATLAGSEVRLWSGEAVPGNGTAGAILGVGPEGITVAANGGAFRITELQRPGRRRLPAWEFARGERLRA